MEKRVRKKYLRLLNPNFKFKTSPLCYPFRNGADFGSGKLWKIRTGRFTHDDNRGSHRTGRADRDGEISRRNIRHQTWFDPYYQKANRQDPVLLDWRDNNNIFSSLSCHLRDSWRSEPHESVPIVFSRP